MSDPKTPERGERMSDEDWALLEQTQHPDVPTLMAEARRARKAEEFWKDTADRVGHRYWQAIEEWKAKLAALSEPDVYSKPSTVNHPVEPPRYETRKAKRPPPDPDCETCHGRGTYTLEDGSWYWCPCDFREPRVDPFDRPGEGET